MFSNNFWKKLSLSLFEKNIIDLTVTKKDFPEIFEIFRAEFLFGFFMYYILS